MFFESPRIMISAKEITSKNSIILCLSYFSFHSQLFGMIAFSSAVKLLRSPSFPS